MGLTSSHQLIPLIENAMLCPDRYTLGVLADGLEDLGDPRAVYYRTMRWNTYGEHGFELWAGEGRRTHNTLYSMYDAISDHVRRGLTEPCVCYVKIPPPPISQCHECTGRWWKFRETPLDQYTKECKDDRETSLA